MDTDKLALFQATITQEFKLADQLYTLMREVQSKQNDNSSIDYDHIRKEFHKVQAELYKIGGEAEQLAVQIAIEDLSKAIETQRLAQAGRTTVITALNFCQTVLGAQQPPLDEMTIRSLSAALNELRQKDPHAFKRVIGE